MSEYVLSEDRPKNTLQDHGPVPGPEGEADHPLLRPPGEGQGAELGQEEGLLPSELKSYAKDDAEPILKLCLCSMCGAESAWLRESTSKPKLSRIKS